MPEIALRIGATAFVGWKTLNVRQTMRGAAGSFAFTASEVTPQDPLSRRILRGAAAEVLLDGERLVTGYVDAVAPSYDATRHTLAVTGRDATADLVDCSARTTPGEWHGARLERIAADLAAPFGIRVSAAVSTGAPFSTFKLEPGETAFAAIDRAARHRALFAISDGAGGLVLTRVSTERLGLELRNGVNVLAASAEFSDRDRFSSYRVLGQQRGSDDFLEATTAAQVVGTAADPEVGRYRPLDVIAEEPGDVAAYRDRARYEASRRKGAALSAVLTVAGWTHPGGAWRPNVRVRVEDAWLGIRREMLITDVALALDEAGRRAELTVAPPEAFELRALPEKATQGVELWF